MVYVKKTEINHALRDNRLDALVETLGSLDTDVSYAFKGWADVKILFRCGIRLHFETFN